MTDIVEQLNIIRAHLHTGAVGQREVWEEWLTEANAEVQQLRMQLADHGETITRLEVEIDRLRIENAALRRALELKP